MAPGASLKVAANDRSFCARLWALMTHGWSPKQSSELKLVTGKLVTLVELHEEMQTLPLYTWTFESF